MQKVRYVVDAITGLAGLAITVLLLFPSGYHASPAILNIFAMIGLFRLNLIGAVKSGRSRYQRLHFAGLFITIVSLLLMHLDIPLGNILVIPGVALIALFHIIELLMSTHKDYLNIMHILIYVVGLIYIIQLRYGWHLSLSSFETISLLNLLVFFTLTFSGFRSLLRRNKPDYGADDTPIDYPSDN